MESTWQVECSESSLRFATQLFEILIFFKSVLGCILAPFGILLASFRDTFSVSFFFYDFRVLPVSRVIFVIFLAAVSYG